MKRFIISQNAVRESRTYLNKHHDRDISFYQCVYFQDCNVKKMPICFGVYENCRIYQKRQKIEKLKQKSKPKSGLERFMERYPDYK